MSDDDPKNDDYWIQDKDYKKYCKQFNVYPNVDVAAAEGNSKCPIYFSKERSALDNEWWKGKGYWKPVIWCNPPLSKCKAFILKAFEQWKRYDLTIMVIVPFGVCGRKYFREIWYDYFIPKRNVEIHPIDRPQFFKKGKNEGLGNRNDYMILIFRSIDVETV